MKGEGAGRKQRSVGSRIDRPVTVLSQTVRYPPAVRADREFFLYVTAAYAVLGSRRLGIRTKMRLVHKWTSVRADHRRGDRRSSNTLLIFNCIDTILQQHWTYSRWYAGSAVPCRGHDVDDLISQSRISYTAPSYSTCPSELFAPNASGAGI